MKFTKMHGAGNDFIILDDLAGAIPVSELPRIAARLCTPHLSVGADGLMAVIPARNGGDYGMLFFNPDGSLGEMCGNGARCISRWGCEHGLAGDVQHIETTAGTVIGERISRETYRVRLNDPSVADERRVNVGGREYLCGYCELGSPGIPHAVVGLPGWEKNDALKQTGRALRFSPAFPKGANVSFAELCGPDEIRLVTYERGVEDFTLACGTGCGSVTTVFTLRGLVSGKDVLLHTDGGDLRVTLDREGGTVRNIFLTGPTVIVFEGETPEF